MTVSKNTNSIDEKFKNDKLKVERITNNDLVCVTCKSKYDDFDMPCNTSKCAKYNLKPVHVLDGGACDEYESS